MSRVAGGLAPPVHDHPPVPGRCSLPSPPGPHYGHDMISALVDELRSVREPKSAQVLVAAPVERVRRLVLDPVAMAGLGEEVESVAWLDGADAPAVGVRFLGRNRNGRRRWTTECTVTECGPERLGYDVHARVGRIRIPISHWRYDVERVDPAVSRVTETNWIMAPLWFAPIGTLVSGALWRPAANRAHIATTLERVRAELEQPAGHRSAH